MPDSEPGHQSCVTMSAKDSEPDPPHVLEAEDGRGPGDDVPERRHYFSTPVQRGRDKGPDTSDLQERLSGYKSFFSSECEELIQQLRGKAVPGWSANKRKLSELDISTIEAEPLPPLSFTFESEMEETTCVAKRRRIDQGDKEDVSLGFSLVKHNSPGFVTSWTRESENFGVNHYRGADRNPEEKSSPDLETQARCSVKASGPAHSLAAISAPEGSPLYVTTLNRTNVQKPRPDLEFRSCFAVECEKICNELKKRDPKMTLGNVSSIEAEPPPVMSDTMNSTVVLERSAKEVAAAGVSHLDLEKMNINSSITDGDLCNSKTTEPKEPAMVSDAAENSPKPYNKGINDGTKRRSVDNAQPSHAGNVQDTATMSYVVMDANMTQDIVYIPGDAVLAGALSPPDKVSLANATRDITMCDEAAGKRSAMKDVQNQTDLSGAQNGTKDIEAFCAVDAEQNIGAMCTQMAAADVTQESMMSQKIAEVDVDTNIARSCSEMSPGRNKTLQNVTRINNNANTGSIHPTMFPEASEETFTRDAVNVTHDIILVKNNIQDATRLISYKETPTTTPDIAINDVTRTFISGGNDLVVNDDLRDAADLTRVIATNCTTFSDASRTEKPHGDPWPEPMCPIKDTTYTLDLTGITHDDSVFYTRSAPFITSTPLPSFSKQMFIKKSRGLPVKSKPAACSDLQDNRNDGVSGQGGVKPHPPDPRKSLVEGPQNGGGFSKGLQYPNGCKSAAPKVLDSRIPQSTPRGILPLSAVHTPQAAIPRKDLVPPGRINVKPPMVASSLPRKRVQTGPRRAASSATLQLQTPARGTTAGDSSKIKMDASGFPASSVVRPPAGITTPGGQIYSGKRLPAPVTAARVYKVSTVIPAPATDRIQPERTFTRPPIPGGSRTKPRVSGLPIRKIQGTSVK
ncbi:uncharacterized protein [Engystomops pustulosus]|uniref:uncharacterized protein n=1 Tax=Engystomops pustulosus TaxID=76066 RepID=UPI003AFA80F9